MKHLTKKILVIGGIIAIISAVFSFVNPTTSFAADATTNNATNNSINDCRNFLGLVSWDCNTGLTNNSNQPPTEETIKSSIWIIVANIVTDITVIAAYLVLGYVIYGGYLYIFSAGDPNKVNSGKKTLTHAFIGLAIVMSAYVIMGAIRIALVGGNGNIGNCTPDKVCLDPGQMVTNLIQWVVGIAGVVALVFIVYGGISYTTSAGDPNKVQKAKQIILYALIGLAIVALAEIITAFVSSTIRNANPNTTTSINQTTILKEVHETQIS